MAEGLFGGTCVENHTAFIYDRGGQNRVAQLQDLSRVQWGRVRDDISEGVVRIEGPACSAQAEKLAAIEPKRSELVIFRGLDRVWEGPVWRVGWHADYVEITAHDIFEYVMATPLTQVWDNSFSGNTDKTTTVTNRVKTILEFELVQPYSARDQAGNPITVTRWEQQNPPANILPYLDVRASPNEARTSALTKAFAMSVGEHIQNLGRVSGIDWTVLGRSLIVWDVSRHLGVTRQLTDADFFDTVIVTAYGADHAQAAYVAGQDGAYGYAVAPDDYYGPWTKIFTAYNEEGTTAPTQSELDSQAKRNLNGRSPVPIEVRIPDNAGIRLNETLTIHDMVPGVQVPLLATLNARKVSQTQKLDHVTVTETPDGETVQVVFIPATKPDEDTEEP